MPDLTDDISGVEGLPLKILLTALIMGIMIPALFTAWSNVERVHLENSLQSELNYLMIRMKQVYWSGKGSSMSVDMNLDSGMFTSIEYVLIGDVLEGSLKNTIRYKLSGDQERMIPIEDGIPVCGRDGASFRLNEGRNTIYLEVKESQNGLLFIEVSSQS